MIEKILSTGVSRQQSWLCSLGISLVGACLIAVAAHIEVPLWPVPVTLQTFMIALLGLTLTPWISLGSVLTYLAMGAIGLPVFAGATAGFADLIGPMGGYFLAFVLTVIGYGQMQQRGWQRCWWQVLMIALLGHWLTLVMGTLYLAFFISLPKAITVGGIPFLLGDSLKCVMLAAMVPGLQQLYKTR